MVQACARRLGAKAKVCAWIATAIVGICSAGPAFAAPIELEETAEPGVVIYPARVTGARPITVVLHGMCSEPRNACRHFADEITKTDHLICPRASRRCEAGGSIWPQRGFAEQVELAVERAKASLPEAADESRGRTLIGYSLGAFRALEIAHHAAGRYPRVMLIGAKIYPSAPLLQKSGVERLLLSAGSWDMMHDHMRRETRRLNRAGYAAGFLGLGPVGHFFTPSFADYLPSALGWLNGASTLE
jgi:predicted esterase